MRSLLHLKVLSLPFLVFLTSCTGQVNRIDQLEFADKNFKKCVANQNLILVSEVEEIDCQRIDITSVEEIKYFKNLKALNIAGNSGLTKVDLSQNLQLEVLDLSENDSITELDISNNLKLKELNVSYVGIEELDMSLSPILAKLVAIPAKFSTLKVSPQHSFEHVFINNHAENPLYELDFTNSPQLIYLGIRNLPLKKLNISNNPKIKTLQISGTQISSLDLSQNLNLEEILTDGTIENWNLSAMKNLRVFWYSGSYNLKELDVTKNTQLEGLEVKNTLLQNINLLNNPRLKTLNLSNNKITALDITTNTKIEHLDLQNNLLKKLDISNNLHLKFAAITSGNPMTLEDVNLADSQYVRILN